MISYDTNLTGIRIIISRGVEEAKLVLLLHNVPRETIFEDGGEDEGPSQIGDPYDPYAGDA